MVFTTTCDLQKLKVIVYLKMGKHAHKSSVHFVENYARNFCDRLQFLVYQSKDDKDCRHTEYVLNVYLSLSDIL